MNESDELVGLDDALIALSLHANQESKHRDSSHSRSAKDQLRESSHLSIKDEKELFAIVNNEYSTKLLRPSADQIPSTFALKKSIAKNSKKVGETWPNR